MYFLMRNILLLLSLLLLLLFYYKKGRNGTSCILVTKLWPNLAILKAHSPAHNGENDEKEKFYKKKFKQVFLSAKTTSAYIYQYTVCIEVIFFVILLH